MDPQKNKITVDVSELRRHLTQFAKERDWDQFHSPKNLSMALSVEVAELVEHFQWLSQDQSASLSTDDLVAVAEEVADIQIYLVRLADKLGIDIGEVVAQKLAENAKKYPADKVRGRAEKYTKYDDDFSE